MADANHGILAVSDSRSPSPIECPSNPYLLGGYDRNLLFPPRCPSPALSELHLVLAEANQDFFVIPDSRAPSPIYIDTEGFFDSPPAPSKRHSYLTEANEDIFALRDSPPPSPKYIDTEDMLNRHHVPRRK